MRCVKKVMELLSGVALFAIYKIELKMNLFLSSARSANVLK